MSSPPHVLGKKNHSNDCLERPRNNILPDCKPNDLNVIPNNRTTFGEPDVLRSGYNRLLKSVVIP